MRRHGVAMALATDCNPGTSPVADLALIVNLGAVLLGLSLEEALAGVTRNAALALGLADRGPCSREAGRPRGVDVDRPAEIGYWVGMGLCSSVWVGGVLSFDRAPEPYNRPPITRIGDPVLRAPPARSPGEPASAGCSGSSRT